MPVTHNPILEVEDTLPYNMYINQQDAQNSCD